MRTVKTKKTTVFAVLLILTMLLSACVAPSTGSIITAPSGETEKPDGTEDATVSDIVIDPPDSQGGAETADTDKAPETSVDTEAPDSGRTVISFIGCGDNLAHEAVLNNGKNYASGTGSDYNFLPIYDDVKDIIASADIAFINQESQIAGPDFEYAGYPRFNTPEQMGDDLIELGFNVIQTANNHMLDCGTEGLSNTIDYWKNKPVIQIGSYSSVSDYENIRILDIKGIKIACLSYTDIINSGREAEAPFITPSLEYDTLEAHVSYAKTKADLVFVYVHWGDEDEFEPTSRQVKYAEYMAEFGVDAIIGTHSHVVGPIEWLERPDGKKTLCAYSLGNFLSTMYYARNMVGLMLDFDIVKEDGEITIENVKVIPTVTYFTYNEEDMDDAMRENLKIYLLEDFTDELAASHAYNEKESKKYTVSELEKFVTDNIDSEFLPDFLK